MRTAIRMVIALTMLTGVASRVAADVSVETILTGLDHPTGVAIRPGGTAESYEVFVVESGSGRVLKASSGKPHVNADVITGFESAALADEDAGSPRTHSLLFLDERKLIVGVDGAPPEVHLFELQGGDKPMTADEASQKVGPELQLDSADVPNGRCVGLSRTRANDFVADMLMVALRGPDKVSGVWKLPVRAGMLTSFSPLKDSPGEVAAEPTALAVSEHGYLVIAAVSAEAKKTLLLFANPTSGEPVLSLDSSLSSICGLAYCPKSGNLYAIATKDDLAGLFRIDDANEGGMPEVSEVKLADIPRPMALAFGPDSALYVTSLGDEDEDSDSGVLLKITGNL